MKRIMIWLASTVTVVVLLFGYYTSTNSPAPESAATSRVPAPAPSAEPSTNPAMKSSSSPSTSPSTTVAATPPPDPTSSSSTSTYTGSTAQTRWGPVQVKITVTNGSITQVTVLQSPSQNPRDQEINDHALPILIKDTLAAQSAQIDMVSGATVTSGGYLQSLQAALDAAGI